VNLDLGAIADRCTQDCMGGGANAAKNCACMHAATHASHAVAVGWPRSSAGETACFDFFACGETLENGVVLTGTAADPNLRLTPAYSTTAVPQAYF
jgi:hypothetical protein